MVAGRPRLGTFLIEHQVITEEQLDLAIQQQALTGCRLGEALIDLGFCSDADIARGLAEQLQIPFIDLDESPPSADSVAMLPREVALEYGLLPVRIMDSRILVAALDPYDIRVDEAIRFATGLHPILAMAPESQLQTQIRQHYSENFLDSSQPGSRDDLEEVDSDEQGQLAVDKLMAAGEQVSTIRIVNALIADAVRRGASDLHIEPEANRVRVRCRINGRMRTITTFPGDLKQSVVARIKIMASMDLAENRKPQDGGCSLKVDGRPVELRVNTLRSIHGEKVVMRILGQDANLQSLSKLGFEAGMYKEFRRLLAGRHGLILITGPTGSGKTTSLYAALNHLNNDELNIITVEDPVEARIAGVTQVQVHDKAGRSFANSLRAMLRQDPDVIMVGEIRDVETADIACRASLTGHLVLSTLHTQHALGTVARLLDMGLESWMVASCLSGVLAQRLVQRVCETCAEAYTPARGLVIALEAQYGSTAGARFRKGRGCGACMKTGNKGRVGVYELLTIDDGLRDLLVCGENGDRLREYVHSRGFRTMEHDAFQKACEGLICPEEIIQLGFSVAMAMEEDEAELEETPPTETPSTAALHSPAQLLAAETEPGSRLASL